MTPFYCPTLVVVRPRCGLLQYLPRVSWRVWLRSLRYISPTNRQIEPSLAAKTDTQETQLIQLILCTAPWAPMLPPTFSVLVRLLKPGAALLTPPKPDVSITTDTEVLTERSAVSSSNVSSNSRGNDLAITKETPQHSLQPTFHSLNPQTHSRPPHLAHISQYSESQ